MGSFLVIKKEIHTEVHDAFLYIVGAVFQAIVFSVPQQMKANICFRTDSVTMR